MFLGFGELGIGMKGKTKGQQLTEEFFVCKKRTFFQELLNTVYFRKLKKSLQSTVPQN